MKTALLQFIDVTIEKVRSLLQNILDRKDNTLDHGFDNDYLDEEIEQKNSRIRLFNKEIGSNPLDHIDWIIENGLVKYNEKYQYFVSGEHDSDEETKRMGSLMSEWGNPTSSSIKAQEKKETKLNLEQAMDYYMQKEELQLRHKALCRDDIIQSTELRGGIGNKVIYSFTEYYPEKDRIYQKILVEIDKEINKI